MRKISLMLSVLLLATITTNCSKEEDSQEDSQTVVASVNNDRKKDKLYGEVKSVVLERFNVEIVEGEAVKSDLSFKEEKQYNINGNITFKEVDNKYTSTLNKYEYEYNSDNKIIKINDYLSNELVKVTLYTYNDDNFVVKITEKLPNGDLLYTYEHTNDTKGQVISGVKYDAASEVVYYWENKFNENGNLIQMKRFDKDDVLISHVEYEFDENENIILAHHFIPEEKVFKVEYNEFNHQTKMINYQNSSQIDQTYEYDNQNNWISTKAIVSALEGDNWSVLYLSERVIEYY